MTYLGIDFGLKKIGLALSDGVLPTPMPVLLYNSQEEVLERLTRLVAEHQVEKIVLGLPQPDKIGTKKFGEKIKHLTGKEVVFIDETLTTKIASEGKKGKKSKAKEDSLAAARLLQDYLESV